VFSSRGRGNGRIASEFVASLRSCRRTRRLSTGRRPAPTRLPATSRGPWLAVVEYPANWRRFRRAAGIIRNAEMLEKGQPDLVLAFHVNLAESRGTRDMVERALAAGVEVRLIDR
jgi:hypothetical protein